MPFKCHGTALGRSLLLLLLHAAARDGTSCLWDARTLLRPRMCSMPSPLQPLATQRRRALAYVAAWDPVAELLWAGGRDGSVAAWNASWVLPE